MLISARDVVQSSTTLEAQLGFQSDRLTVIQHIIHYSE